MPIDITKMEGYKPEMTSDEKLAMLLKYEPPAQDLSGFIKKDTFDKTASELAEAKKALKAKMTEDELKDAERAAIAAAKDAELESLRKEKTVSEMKAKYLGLGYDEALATESALAHSTGDTEKVFANQAKHLENVRKAATATAMANDPLPPPGTGSTTIDYGKSIAEAQANSDYGTAAMLMRQQQEATMTK